MSSSITTSNGLLVVTQVFPQDPSDKTTLPEQNVTSSIQTAQPSLQDKVSQMTVMFLGGNPRSLGIAQIVIGLLFITFSVINLLSALLSPELLVMGLTFVVSGSLAVAARNGTRPDMIMCIGVLALHAVSVLAAVSGMAYLCYLMCAGIIEEDLRDLDWVKWVMNAVWTGVRGVLLLLCVLEVCVSITVCVFSGKALHAMEAKQDSPHVAAIKSGSTPLAGSLSASESDVPLLDEAAEEVVSRGQTVDSRDLQMLPSYSLG